MSGPTRRPAAATTAPATTASTATTATTASQIADPQLAALKAELTAEWKRDLAALEQRILAAIEAAARGLQP